MGYPVGMGKQGAKSIYTRMGVRSVQSRKEREMTKRYHYTPPDHGPDCAHGFPLNHRTRLDEPACPHCRRIARKQTNSTLAPALPSIRPPAGDWAALAANDEELQDQGELW